MILTAASGTQNFFLPVSLNALNRIRIEMPKTCKWASSHIALYLQLSAYYLKLTQIHNLTVASYAIWGSISGIQ